MIGGEDEEKGEESVKKERARSRRRKQATEHGWADEGEQGYTSGNGKSAHREKNVEGAKAIEQFFKGQRPG